MATAKEREDNRQLQEDVQQLKTNVALIKQEQKNQTSTLNKVNLKLDTLAFVSQKDYDEDMARQQVIDAAQNKRIEALEKMVNAGGVKVANALNSGVSKAIITALIVGLLALIVWSLARVTPALGGV